MAMALCIQCGAFKGGSFEPCEACGFMPMTDVELARSLFFTVHHFSQEQLEHFQRLHQVEGKILVLDPKQEAEMVRGVRESGIRRMIGIPDPEAEQKKKQKAKAKKQRRKTLWQRIAGIFEPEKVKARYVIHSLIRDKTYEETRTITKKLYQKHVASDGKIYAVIALEDGKKRLKYLPKGAWDMMQSQFAAIDREAAKRRKETEDTFAALRARGEANRKHTQNEASPQRNQNRHTEPQEVIP